MRQPSQPKLQTRGDCVLSRTPLFGRLTEAGRDYLLRHGWEMATSAIEDDDYTKETRKTRLAFAWTSKSGPQFEIEDVGAAHVRPFPKEWTDAFDDKLRLSRAIEGSAITPVCIASPPREEAVKSDRLYFVKHRLGAQGKSVYVYDGQELMAWSHRSKNARDFVIQEEIAPVLYGARKFVLRCHLLLALRDGNPPTLRTWLHRKSIICQHHASMYKKGCTEKSSQISQAGKRHPPPILIEELDRDHPAAGAYDKIRACSRELVRKVLEGEAFAGSAMAIAPETTCFALLGADLLMDERGEVKVCEVNSHPALGWGTMAKVPKRVFSDLIEEALSLVLLDGDEEETGFDHILGHCDNEK